MSIRNLIAVLLFGLSWGAAGIGVQAEGIVNGPCIGCMEGIVNAGAAASCFTPTVSSVTPNQGLPAGGTAVTIGGTNFTGATVVNFGANPASYSVSNSTTIQVASSPAGSPATVDITVTTPCGTSPTSASDHFTYASPQIQLDVASIVSQ